MAKQSTRFGPCSGLLVATIVIGLTLSGCTASSPNALNADGGKVSAIPNAVLTNQDIEADSVRLLASVGPTTFYAARLENSGPAVVCLLASDPTSVSWWPQACGEAPFSMVADGTMVKFFPNGVEKEIPPGWTQEGEFLLVHVD